MTMSLNSAIARIRTADDVVVGAGFLVGQRQVLTCAHVIDTALDRPRNTLEIFQTEVHLDAKRTADGRNARWERRVWGKRTTDGGNTRWEGRGWDKRTADEGNTR